MIHQIARNEWLQRFQYFNLKTNYLKNTNPFEKTGVVFLVENTEIDNETFPYKAALSKAHVKT